MAPVAAEVDPEKVFICKCTDCQKMAGGTCHANVPVAESDLCFVSDTKSSRPDGLQLVSQPLQGMTS